MMTQPLVRDELRADPVIRELMPLTVRLWNGEPLDVDYAELRAEDVAYGEYILAHGIDDPGMFYRRCTAAAMRERNATQRLCDAIEHFDLDTFIERLKKWQRQ